MMITKKATKEQMDRYEKDKKFITIVDGNLYIVNDIEYRLLSENEIIDFNSNDIFKLENNKYITEKSTDIEVRPIFRSSKSTKKILKKNYPTELPKMVKDEMVRQFRNAYIMKLSSYLSKSNESDFYKINKQVLKDLLHRQISYQDKVYNLIDSSQINLVKKSLENTLFELTNHYNVFPLGKFINLQILENKIVFEKVKILAVDREKAKNIFFDKIENPTQ